MTTPPGAYGGYPVAAPRPRKYRPSASWFVAGIALILVAVAIAVGTFVWLLAGFFRTDATLSADGEPHRVSVGADGERMLWFEDTATTCRIVDLATGDRIRIRTVGGSFERSDPDGDLSGLFRFTPGSGDLEITCVSPFTARGSGGTVLIGPMPELDSIVVGVLLAVGVPGLLGLTGLVVLIWTGILWSLRDPRPRGA